jgi:tocopherol O-methyltransferase
MIECPNIDKKVIRHHYDLVTPFYWLLWGRHIHHGLWDDPAATPATSTPAIPTAPLSSARAQQRLTDTMEHEAGIVGGDRVLDVGCGMGGSSIHLARKLHCQVTGITVSPFQRLWAQTTAALKGVSRRTTFQCVDAEIAVFPAESFDIVWSIECTEHLYDKAHFFEQAARWLRPGGRMAICAWLAGENLQNERQIRLVHDVCEGFFCPSLGTFGDYRRWMTDAGLEVVREHDWTARVDRTWEICDDRVRRSGLRRLAGWVHADTAMFLDRFKTILDAYRSGAMQYGCFIAEKAPSAQPTALETV